MKKFLVLTTFVAALYAAPLKAEEFTSEQKEELNKLLTEYLMNNGQVILESVNKFQAEQMAKQQQESNEKAKGYMADQKKDTTLPSTGNPDGDITIVEFFDYNCGYCRKALNEVNALLKDEKNVKVVFIEMPILGPQSKEAAKWSLAANKQGKYFEYHQAIMDHKGPKDDKNMKKLAEKVGLDIKQLEKDKDGDDINQIIVTNLTKARELGIQGTPGFIVETEVARGYITSAQMKSMIASIRGQ